MVVNYFIPVSRRLIFIDDRSLRIYGHCLIGGCRSLWSLNGSNNLDYNRKILRQGRYFCCGLWARSVQAHNNGLITVSIFFCGYFIRKDQVQNYPHNCCQTDTFECEGAG